MIRPPTRAAARRTAYTLLEVVLASFITALLMAGLYVALNIQFDYADTGRTVVEETKLARDLIKRLSDDTNLELAQALPQAQGSGSKAQGGGGSPATNNTNNTNTNNNNSNNNTNNNQAANQPVNNGGNNTNSNTNTNTNNASGQAANLPGGPVTFNLGVQGTDTQLTLYVSRVPRELFGKVDPNNTPLVSDLRRITYFMVEGGLARQEVKQATSNDATVNMPPDVPDAESLLISNRVRAVTFSYWDGTEWQDSWDGTETSDATDGTNTSAPKGPPMAIRIELKITPADDPKTTDSKRWKTYRHTIPIPSANRLIPLTQQQQQQLTASLQNQSGQ